MTAADLLDDWLRGSGRREQALPIVDAKSAIPDSLRSERRARFDRRAADVTAMAKKLTT